MNAKVLLGTVGLTGVAIVLGQVGANANDRSPSPTDRVAATTPSTDGDFVAIGASPDVIVGELQEYVNYSASGGYDAYSVGTTSCNLGNINLTWTANNNQHPVISQNMYRIDTDGKFEHLGQGWLKHGFCALQGGACGSCSPAGAGCPQALGVGCSDPYSASRNGGQSNAGPKYQINATTGFFPYPPADPTWSGGTARRLRVALLDVLGADTGANAGAQYMVEGMYVHWQDNPASGGESNNASHRRINMNDSGNITGFIGGTQREEPAIMAWPDFVPEATVQTQVIPGEGTMWVGSAAIDNGDGTWDYIYAIYNSDVDRSGGSLEIPIGSGVTITDIGQRHPEWHSGEPYKNDLWSVTQSAGSISFETMESFSQDPNGNAIRWATTSTFWFTADSAPRNGEATIGLFKPGTPSSFAKTLPTPMDVTPIGCDEDIDGDLAVGFTDLTQLLAAWGPCPGCPEDLDGDGSVGFTDLTQLLAAWGPCP